METLRGHPCAVSKGWGGLPQIVFLRLGESSSFNWQGPFLLNDTEAETLLFYEFYTENCCEHVKVEFLA